MHVLAAFLIGVALTGGFLEPRDFPEGTYMVETGLVEPTLARQALPSMAEKKFHNVVRQMYDYSCGSAALTTLLNYYLAEQLTEGNIINGLLKYGDVQRIAETRAFSLLDMKSLVQALGYEAHGYKTQLEDIRKLKIPYIVSIDLYGYLHFVVVKGIFKDHVMLADPSMGNISFPLSKFERIWYKNVIFVVLPKSAPLEYQRPGMRRIARRVESTDFRRAAGGNGYGNGNGNGNAEEPERVERVKPKFIIPTTPEEINALGLGLIPPASYLARVYGVPESSIPADYGNGFGNTASRGYGNGYGNTSGGYGNGFGNTAGSGFGNGYGNTAAAKGNGYGNGDGLGFGNGYGNTAG
ncbi:MAG: hypothetical protein KKA60_06745, partial [Proteobacteria bacterium]|nr:hypothetical protein [Pseudomonadota bacterium]